jgi:hypothetical protein
MDRHKEGPKKNPRMCDVAGRNCRLRRTNIIEVSYMYSSQVMV